MKITNHIIIALITFYASGNEPAYPQDARRIELTAQEIVARADRVLNYPKGLVRGKIIHITPDGASNLIEITGSVSEEDYVFKFATKSRGEELRVLYNLRGEDIWVYNMLSIKLFNKRGVDKYDPILGTNYYYIDLSNVDLQSNYTAELTGEAFIKGVDTYKLKLNPIMRGGNYGLLTIYVSKKDFIPLRIDYHDPDKVIFKTMTIAKVMKKDNRIIPIRYDMLDISKGTVTLLEFYGFNEEMTFDKKIFIHQNLGVRE
jgi:hypothetical protein